MKSLPIGAKLVYDSKILVNLTICIPASLLSSILTMVAMNVKGLELVFLFMLPIAGSFLTSIFGIWVNNHFYSFDWEAENQVVKQSIGSILGFFVIPMPLLLVGITSALIGENLYNLTTLIFITAMLIASFILYSVESRRPLVKE